MPSIKYRFFRQIFQRMAFFWENGLKVSADSQRRYWPSKNVKTIRLALKPLCDLSAIIISRDESWTWILTWARSKFTVPAAEGIYSLSTNLNSWWPLLQTLLFKVNGQLKNWHGPKGPTLTSISENSLIQCYSIKWSNWRKENRRGTKEFKRWSRSKRKKFLVGRKEESTQEKKEGEIWRRKE